MVRNTSLNKTTRTIKRKRRTTPKLDFRKNAQLFNKALSVNNIKYMELQITDSGFSTSGTIYDLMQGNITPGSSPKAQFNGQAIQIRSIQLRGHVFGIDSTQVMRCILFQRITPQASLAVSQVLETVSVQSMPDFSHTDDMIILRDWYFVLTAPYLASSSYGGSMNPNIMECYIKGSKCVRSQWDVDNSIWTQGKIYVLLISDSAASSHPSALITIRITYTDLI